MIHLLPIDEAHEAWTTGNFALARQAAPTHYLLFDNLHECLGHETAQPNLEALARIAKDNANRNRSN